MEKNTPFVLPVSLEGYGACLRPLALEHEQALAAAAADGELWKIRCTSVPAPADTRKYIEWALEMRERGSRFAFAVYEQGSDELVGTTGYHDIVAEIRRLEIGYTWYAKRMQKTFLNTACKFLLMHHAFETLDANVVALRTDVFNRASRVAIERLGAKMDGILRGHAIRRDGTIRDTVMYSITAGEWPEIKAHLQYLMRDRPAL